MAKFAQCGYGSQGQGLGKTTEGYTYVVNDNVRVGQRIQVVSTSHGKEPKKFVTTAVPLNTYKENSKLGQIQKSELDSKNIKPTKAYSGGELGASGETAKKDIVIGSQTPQSQYTITSRALAGQKYLQTHPDTKFTENTKQVLSYYQENKPQKGKQSSTFADYSRPFMNKGEQ